MHQRRRPSSPSTRPATGMLSSFWLLIAIPLASAADPAAARPAGRPLGSLCSACASVGVAFVLGLIYFFQLRGLPDEPRGRS